MTTLTQLAEQLPIVLIVVGLLLLLIVLYVIFLVVRSSPQLRAEEAAPPPPAPGAAEPPPPAGSSPLQAMGRSIDLRRSFRRTMRSLKRQLNAGDAVYQLPFYLVIGTAGAESPDFWDSSDLSLPFGPPLEDSQRPDRCNFWIYDRGVVADLGGDYVLRQDGTADEAGLRLALRLLQKYRPARPLDGVIVPVSARELLGAGGLEGFSALEQRADAVYRALWQIQKQLGMLFPVYLVITDGEAVGGFAELAASLPEAQRGEMVGWSNPYHINQTYRSEWAEEAFAALGRDLRAAQKEAFVEGPPPPVAERLLLLPSEAARLEEPARRYLDRLFKPTAYHEPIQLRGIYLCARDVERRRTYFLRDLLERKIFSELALAKPAARALLARQRLLSLAQWATLGLFLFLALGTTVAYRRLEGGRVVLEPFFRDALQDLRELRRLESAGELPPRQLVDTWSESLLDGIERIHIDHFGSLFFPQSWTRKVDRQINLAYDLAFRDIIFEAMARDLAARADQLTAQTLAAPEPERLSDPRLFERPEAESEAVSPEASLEMAALRSYLEELLRLERHVELFNDLRRGNLHDFAKLVHFTFRIELAEEFFSHTGLIRDVLAYQQLKVELAPLRPRALAKTAALTRRLVEHCESNQLAAGLESLAFGLDNVDGPGFGGSRTAAYQDLLEEIRWVEGALTEPGNEWMFRERFELGDTFAQTLAAARGLALVGEEGAATLQQAGELCWITQRRRLAAARSRFTGPLLQVQQGQPRMALSGDVQLLQVALEELLGEGFMGDNAVLEPRPYSAGSRILWDAGLLESAVALYEPYQRFRSRGLEAFPADLRITLDQVARESLADRIAALVAQAQTFRAEISPSHAMLFEQELRDAAANLIGAAPLLEKLQSTLGDLDQWSRQQAIQLLIARQAGALLRELDEMVEREQPYRIRGGDFSWWPGDRPIGFEPFEKADLAETTMYLDSQRRRLQQLATEIGQPLASLLSKTGFHQQPQYRVLFDRWEGIATALQAYDAKKPGGSLETLEKFLLAELPQTSLESCARTPAPPLRSGDYFAARLSEVQRALNLRCGGLRGELAASHWRRLESFFNQRLAGRYPFAPPGDAAISAALADDVRAFFRLFDESLPLLRAVRGDQGPLLPIAGQMGEFLDEMEGVRAFFAPFLDAKVRSAEPFYDLDVEMRVNREHERCGEQIIEWVLDRGGLTVDQRSTGKTVRWQPGQPLELRLRWAKDAPALPAGGAGRAGFFVDGSWAVWRFSDRWALLHLLEALAAEPQDFTGFEDPAPHTLRLSAALRKAPAPAEDGPPPAVAGVTDPTCPPDAAETRVYVRLRVLAPEDKGLLVRRPFPLSAPRLEDFSGVLRQLPPVKAPR